MKNNITNKKTQISLTISAIKELTSNGFNEGFARYKKNTTFVRCASILRNMGVVVNNGSYTRPSYSWNEEKANSIKNLTKAVIDGLKQKPFVSAFKTSAAQPAMKVAVLTTFTDQQLWDELKSRQYHIENNQLCKMTYLQ